MPEQAPVAGRIAGPALDSLRPALLSAAALVFFSGLLSAAAALFLLALYRSLIPGGSVLGLGAAVAIVTAAIIAQGAFRFRAGQILDRAAGLWQVGLGHPADGPPPAEALPLLRALRGRAALAVLDLSWVPVFLIVTGLIHPAFALAATGLGVIFLLLGPLEEPFERRGSTPDMRQKERLRRASVAILRDLSQVALLALGGMLAIRGAVHVGELVAATMLAMRALGAVQGLAEERPVLRALRLSRKALASR